MGGIFTLNTFGDAWPGIWWMDDINIAKGMARNHRCIELFDAVPIFSFHLHLMPLADPLAVDFALDVRCDCQFSAVPEAIHVTS